MAGAVIEDFENSRRFMRSLVRWRRKRQTGHFGSIGKAWRNTVLRASNERQINESLQWSREQRYEWA